jgi:flagellar FliL protein
VSAAPAAKGAGVVPFLAVTLALAAAGGGGGFFLVKHAMAVAREDAAKAASQEPEKLPEHVSGTKRAEHLPPLITTLATSGAWVRLEAAMVYDSAPGKLPPTLTLEITEDMLAYLRTLTVSHIAGPSGFQHLKQDLAERALIRSEGRVEDILIQVLVFE